MSMSVIDAKAAELNAQRELLTELARMVIEAAPPDGQRRLGRIADAWLRSLQALEAAETAYHDRWLAERGLKR